jgi:hypothetical protein
VLDSGSALALLRCCTDIDANATSEWLWRRPCGRLLARRSVQLLAALAAALAEVLPGAAATLRENLSAVLSAEPRAASTATADTTAATRSFLSGVADSRGGGGGRSRPARQPSEVVPKSAAAISTGHRAASGSDLGSDGPAGSSDSICAGRGNGSQGGSDAGTCAGAGSGSNVGSGSLAGSGDSISAVAGTSDTELEPFLELNFCAGRVQMAASHSRTGGAPAATPRFPLTPSSPAGTGDTVPADTAEEHVLRPDSPRYCADISSSESGGDASSEDGRDSGGSSERHGSRESTGGRGDGDSRGLGASRVDAGGEDVAVVKAALHVSALQRAAPAAGPGTPPVGRSAYLRSHAASSYKVRGSRRMSRMACTHARRWV